MIERRDPIELVADGVRVRVDPNHGGEITHLGRPDGPNVLFEAHWLTPLPAGPGSRYPTSQHEWQSQWRGGWQELFPNAGSESTWLGTPLPQHGEVSRSRWQVLDCGTAHIAIRTPTRLPIVLTRTMQVVDGSLRMTESATNESDLPIPVVWTQHPAFDAIDGLRIDAPETDVVVPDRTGPAFAELRPGTYRWPQILSATGAPLDLSAVPSAPTVRMAYLIDIAEPWIALRRPDGVGVAMTWDPAVYRHVWMWTQIGDPHFPWFGRARAIAIEPSVAWPGDGLAAAVEHGQALTIAPGGELTSWFTVRLFTATGAQVTAVGADGTVRTS